MSLRYLLGAIPLLAGALAPTASAADCASLAVEIDAPLHARWADHLRETLQARGDIEACAHIRLSARAGSIQVEVSLPDGRFAARSVSRREDVLPALQALLLVPRVDPPEREVAVETAQETPPQPAPAARVTELALIARQPPTDRAEPEPKPEPEPEPDVGVEFSIATGARIGEGLVGVGLGALSFLDLTGWLLGFEGRADQYHSLASGPAASALELGVLLGRRFRFGNLGFDLTTGPVLALSGGGSVSRTGPASVPVAPLMESDERITPRILACARLNFSARSLLRSFVSLDGVLDPAHLAKPASRSLELPVWSLGLALGVTVGTR